MLRPHAAGETFGDPANANSLIHGDNLDALKALLPFHRGRVKCIFIDPPYNTRSAFEHYDDNLEHAQWLTMMLPRLQLLRDLLSADGSIWVTIDDNEGHYLKVLMDEGTTAAAATRWAGAGSASRWATTQSRTACRDCKKSSTASKAASATAGMSGATC